jgi:hypothetical protein
LLILTCPPLIQALGHGQNTCISLLLLAITVTLWQSDRAMLAGAAAGLLFYKPQLGAIVALALVLSLGWRPLAGLAMTGTALLLTTLIALPSTLSTFLQRLPGNIAYMQVEHRYYWDRHVTLKAFWRLLLQGYDAGDLTPLTRVLYFASIAVVASLLLVTIWKLRGDRASRDRLIAMTIVAMPLLMPFYFDYDLLLLAAAGVLTAREVMDSQQPLSKWLLTTWIALFFWTMFNPAIAGRFHVNGSVILLTTLTGLLIARARKLVANTKVETNQAPRTIGKLRPYDAAA